MQKISFLGKKLKNPPFPTTKLVITTFFFKQISFKRVLYKSLIIDINAKKDAQNFKLILILPQSQISLESAPQGRPFFLLFTNCVHTSHWTMHIYFRNSRLPTLHTYLASTSHPAVLQRVNQSTKRI